MDVDRRSELIEKLAQVEVEMDIIRKRLPAEVDSLEKLLNSIDELNFKGRERDKFKRELQAAGTN